LLLALIDQLPEKVLSLGDLVSLSFRKFRQNLRLYWSALIIPAVGTAVGSNGAYYAFDHWVSIASKSMLAVGPFAMHMAMVLLGIIIWFVGVWEPITRASAIMRLILGLDQDYASAAKWIKSRSRSIFGAYNIIILPPLISLLLWTFVAFLFVSFIPIAQPQRLIVGSLGFGMIGFGLTVSISLSALFGALLLSIIASEGLPFGACLNRAFYFFKLRMLRGGSFICLMTMSLLLVFIACYSPVIILALVEQFTHADLGLQNRSVPIMFLEALLDTTFNVISFGIGFTGYGLFYRDLRLRLEGHDLLTKIEKLNSN